MIVHFTGIISSCEAIALSNYIDTQCATFLKFPITREVIEQFIAQLWNQFQLNVWRIGIDAAVRCSPGCQNPIQNHLSRLPLFVPHAYLDSFRFLLSLNPIQNLKSFRPLPSASCFTKTWQTHHQTRKW
ncbi:hypothetical protein OsccyDRAFT_0431 [Leptolyngbyaceae cyanobacterium JSC-12]|nr:hypothetical protein OsccyDRAFT_0431 [Leptolyngbyaceae cyanobacterium JSC-12]